MQICFGIWEPGKSVTLRVSGSSVSLWVNEELNENVAISFRGREGLREFAAHINHLLEKEQACERMRQSPSPDVAAATKPS
jgi:hypothetical protein